MEKTIAASDLNWEFVRPGLLNNKPLTEKYKVQTKYFKKMKVGGISRADVADFLVKQAENPTLSGKYPALSNKIKKSNQKFTDWLNFSTWIVSKKNL